VQAEKGRASRRIAGPGDIDAGLSRNFPWARVGFTRGCTVGAPGRFCVAAATGRPRPSFCRGFVTERRRAEARATERGVRVSPVASRTAGETRPEVADGFWRLRRRDR